MRQEMAAEGNPIQSYEIGSDQDPDAKPAGAEVQE
jgi:hypothetical protein